MRFKIFLTHFLVVIVVLAIMGIAGYFSLKASLENQMESELQRRAEFLETRLNSPLYKENPQELIDKYGMGDSEYAWIITPDGEFVAYPSQQESLNPYYKDRDKKQVNSREIKEETPAFIVGQDIERRMVYPKRLNSGNFLIVSRNMARTEGILSSYLRASFYTGVVLLFISLFILMYLSKETIKPVLDLQEYAKNLSVGEIIDRAESFKNTDVYSIASTLERLYTQTRKDKSLDQNPLSGLPGNKSLYDALFRRIEAQEHLAIGFVDANNFTAYNNKYGFEKGDSVIRFIGVTILNAIKEKGNEEDKIYHLGGDRFIFISTPDKVKDICEKIIRDYDTQIVYYYDEEAQQKGYIVSTDKNGNTGEFPFMPICIGVATNLKRPLIHPLQIGHIVGEIRNYLRERRKSDYLIDRRRTDREEEHKGEMAPFTREELEEVRKEIEKMEQEEKVRKKEGQPVREITGKKELKAPSSPTPERPVKEKTETGEKKTESEEEDKASNEETEQPSSRQESKPPEEEKEKSSGED